MEETNKCTYCGSEYNIQREHVIPAIWDGWRGYDQTRQWIVPACSDCNKLAGSNIFFSIPEKAHYLLNRYKRKLKAILKMPFWSQKELDEMDRFMRIAIEESMVRSQIAKHRVSYLEGISNMPPDFNRSSWVTERYAEYIAKIKKKKYKKRKKNKDIFNM